MKPTSDGGRRPPKRAFEREFHPDSVQLILTMPPSTSVTPLPLMLTAVPFTSVWPLLSSPAFELPLAPNAEFASRFMLPPGLDADIGVRFNRDARLGRDGQLTPYRNRQVTLGLDLHLLLFRVDEDPVFAPVVDDQASERARRLEREREKKEKRERKRESRFFFFFEISNAKYEVEGLKDDEKSRSPFSFLPFPENSQHQRVLVRERETSLSSRANRMASSLLALPRAATGASIAPRSSTGNRSNSKELSLWQQERRRFNLNETRHRPLLLRPQQQQQRQQRFISAAALPNDNNKNEGDEVVQETLAEMIRLQVGAEEVKEFVEKESEKLERAPKR